MAEESTPAAEETSTPEVPEGVDASVELAPATDAATQATGDAQAEDKAQTEGAEAAKTPVEADASTAPSEPEPPKEPDDIHPLIAKVCETIQHEVEDEELDKFLRAHIKPFREEWDTWRAEAKDAYLHMMASQLVQRKAAKTRIMIYEAFKLPVPSAQTKLFESIKQSQVKPKRCIPVLLMPPNLRPTYSLKK